MAAYAFGTPTTSYGAPASQPAYGTFGVPAQPAFGGASTRCSCVFK